MFQIFGLVRAASPEPFPSPTAFDSSKVTPGPMGGIVFLLLTIAVVVLLFSFSRHMKKINFEESED